MAKLPAPEPESADNAHAWAETRHQCGPDAALREAGWRIFGRPTGGEPLWVKDGRIVGEALAFTEAMAEKRRQAKLKGGL